MSNTNLEKNGSRRIGAELEIRAQPIGWLEMNLQVSYINARFIESGGAIPGTASFIMSGYVLAGREKGLRAGLYTTWLGPRNLAHGALVRGYFKLDASAGYRFDYFEVTVAVRNLFNARYMEGAYHFASWFDRETPRSNIPLVHYAAGEPLTMRILLTVFWG